MKNEAESTADANVRVDTPKANEVDFFAYIGERSDYDDLVDLVADSLESEDFIACKGDGTIEEVDLDEGRFSVRMSAPCHIVDEGIGSYEFWGTCGVHHDYEPALDDEDSFVIDIDCEKLAAAGMTADATFTNEYESDTEDEDGCGTAYCTEYVTVSVTDPVKFEAWVAAALAKKASAHAA